MAQKTPSWHGTWDGGERASMDAREEKKTSARLVRAGMRRSGDLVGAPPRREVSAEIVSVGHEVRGHARRRSRLDAAVVAAREDAAVAPAAHHAAHAVAAAVHSHAPCTL